jgi:predicted dehydrogenase
MTIRGALIGCGQVSQHHLRGWSQIDGVEIVALSNRTVSKAEDRARQFNIPLDHVYGDYNEMLDKEEVDFVDIASAPNVHREHVEAVAARGRHVFCQKPFAPTMNDAQAMTAACDMAGVLLSINENWRWRAWYRDLKRILNTDVVGHIRYVSVTKHRSVTLPGPDGSPPPLAAEPHAMEHDRLIVYDWGIHLIDLLRFLFGEITSIYAVMDNVSPYVKGEDRALLTLNIKQIMAVIDISWASILAQPDTMNLDTRPENIIIEGDKGTIELPEYGNIIRVTTESTTSEQPAYEGTPLEAYQASYTAAQRHFIECLRSGQLPETEARDNLKTLMVTFAAYESAAKNQVIYLKYNQ